jgi:hypothetical protein
MLYVWYVQLTRPSIFIRDNQILSSERILHRDYNSKDSIEKSISSRETKMAWRQDELIGSKPQL